MDSYQSRPLLPMPEPRPYKDMSDEELHQFIRKSRNFNLIIPALIESNERKDKKIADLTRRIEFLEEKSLKKAGRKRQIFYLDFKELTDEYLEYLVDYDYMTISEIEKHMEQYTTKYYESDNRWHSFLPDATHPRKMKPIVKRKLEDLEQAIIDYYIEQEEANKRKRITLRTLFPEWFDYKWQDTNNSAYMKRIHHDWNRFYENNAISDRPIVEMTTLELKNWARNKIIKEKLTKKLYYNMTVIIRQSLDYLVELGELPSNPFSNFKIKSS